MKLNFFKCDGKILKKWDNYSFGFFGIQLISSDMKVCVISSVPRYVNLQRTKYLRRRNRLLINTARPHRRHSTCHRQMGQLAQRCQILHLLEIDDIVLSNTHLIIHMLKQNWVRFFFFNSLIFNSHPRDTKLCIVSSTVTSTFKTLI